MEQRARCSMNDGLTFCCIRCHCEFNSDTPVKISLCPDCRTLGKPRIRVFYKIYRLDTNLGLRFLLRRVTTSLGLDCEEDVSIKGSLEEARFLVPEGKVKTTLKNAVEYNLIETWF